MTLVNMAIPSEDLMCCTVCKISKPLSEMNANSRKVGSRERRCKACQSAYERQNRAKDREAHCRYHREWRAKLGDKYRKYISDHRRMKISKLSPEGQAEFRRKECAKSKRLAEALKNEVFTAYGGWICACCSEIERSFLTIDHMLNNGSKLRREGVHGHSTMFYRWLKKSGYPKDFQVLCMNCQFGKRMNQGTCPHRLTCND